MQRLVECFGWCHPVEGLSRTAIELGGDGVEVGWVWIFRSLRRGRYWRSRPLVFSLVPRCQGLSRACRWPRDGLNLDEEEGPDRVRLNPLRHPGRCSMAVGLRVGLLAPRRRRQRDDDGTSEESADGAARHHTCATHAAGVIRRSVSCCRCGQFESRRGCGGLPGVCRAVAPAARHVDHGADRVRRRRVRVRHRRTRLAASDARPRCGEHARGSDARGRAVHRCFADRFACVATRVRRYPPACWVSACRSRSSSGRWWADSCCARSRGPRRSCSRSCWLRPTPHWAKPSSPTRTCRRVYVRG